MSGSFGFANLYGCEIGDDVKIGTFVEIQKGAKIGNRCKISSHTFICEGVTLEDEVFVGHNVTFTNDRYPRATNGNGQLQTEADWACIPTLVKRGASIGSGATAAVRHHRWRKRLDRRGQRGDPGCAAGHRRGGQSGPGRQITGAK